MHHTHLTPANSTHSTHPHIYITWRGPYAPTDFKHLDDGKGLYLISGCTRRQRKIHLQYIGAAPGTYAEHLRDHPILPTIIRSCAIWTGAITQPAFSDDLLSLARHLLIFSLHTPLNTDRSEHQPAIATIESRWRSYSGPYTQARLPYFPYKITWDGHTCHQQM